METKLTKYKKRREIATAFLLASAAAVILPELALAEGALDPAYAKLKGIYEGSGALIICLLSLTFSIIGSIFKFNPALITGSLGVSIVSGVGPKIIETLVK